MPVFPDGVNLDNPCLDLETGEAIHEDDCKEERWSASFRARKIEFGIITYVI